jgi:hypothetical protein
LYHTVGTIGNHVTGAQDLLHLFSLEKYYTKFCKSQPSLQPGQQTRPSSSSSSTKLSTELDPTYLAYIPDLPGKNEVLQERTLRDAIMAPQRGDPLTVIKFEKDLVAAAFTLKPGQIPGVGYYLSISSMLLV